MIFNSGFSMTHATYINISDLEVVTSRYVVPYQSVSMISLIFNVLHHASSISFHFHSRRPAAAAGLAAWLSRGPCGPVTSDAPDQALGSSLVVGTAQHF